MGESTWSSGPVAGLTNGDVLIGWRVLMPVGPEEPVGPEWTVAASCWFGGRLIVAVLGPTGRLQVVDAGTPTYLGPREP